MTKSLQYFKYRSIIKKANRLFEVGHTFVATLLLPRQLFEVGHTFPATLLLPRQFFEVGHTFPATLLLPRQFFKTKTYKIKKNEI